MKKVWNSSNGTGKVEMGLGQVVGCRVYRITLLEK